MTVRSLRTLVHTHTGDAFSTVGTRVGLDVHYRRAVDGVQPLNAKLVPLSLQEAYDGHADGIGAHG